MDITFPDMPARTADRNQMFDAPPEMILSMPGGQSPEEWVDDDLLTIRDSGAGRGPTLSILELSEVPVVRPYLGPEPGVGSGVSGSLRGTNSRPTT